MEVRDCPGCGKKKLVPLGQVSLIRSAVPEEAEQLRNLKRCSACGSIAVAPFPREEILRKYYEKYTTITKNNQNDDENNWCKRDILQSIQDITKKIEKGRILDIGCGDGTLLSMLPSSFEKYGVDLSKSACAQAYKRGFNVFCSSFLSCSFPHDFDIIIALDVLEHFSEPRRAIQRMADILASGGYLIIQTGNADSFEAHLLAEDWAYTAVFGHLCALTPSAIRIMTSDVNIEEISLTTSWHRMIRWRTVIFCNARALVFHAYRRFYILFKPLLKNVSFLHKLYHHHPPKAHTRDHFTYIGQKV